MKREEARKLYSESGITYSQISNKETALLSKILKEELEDGLSDSELKACKLRKGDVDYNDDGSIRSCYFMVDGSNFKRREAISFNMATSDSVEFIGFCGWAGGNNADLIVSAFVKWVNLIRGK